VDKVRGVAVTKLAETWRVSPAHTPGLHASQVLGTSQP
jgi:hypothetical protein